MHLNFPQAQHLNSLRHFDKEDKWMAKISHAVCIAQDQQRTHILLVFTHSECTIRNDGYLFKRFLELNEAFANLGYRTQLAPISQGYSFLMSWGHHARATE